MTHDTEIGRLTANLHNRIFNLSKLKEYTTFRTRLQFMNAFVVGKLRYMLPIYMNATTDNINKLHKVLMRCARVTIGNYCCRMNTAAILGKCKWLGIKKFIVHSGLIAVNKIIKKEVWLLLPCCCTVLYAVLICWYAGMLVLYAGMH